MKSNNLNSVICSFFCIFLPILASGQIDLRTMLEEKAKAKFVKELISKFEKGQPISTTFDDADYEAVFLDNFEPLEKDYLPLDIQPKIENGGGYKLRSGVYTMNAKSFCLRGYTHGPSKGDGHLYAPLKGNKASFVKSIIQHYTAKPEIPQQDVQVLLWAIIAGADMKTLGNQYSKTLNALYTNEEIIKLQAEGFLDTEIEKTTIEIKKYIVGKVPDKLQELFDADDKIRTLVSGNKTFQEIEKVAIIPGIAPIDMIREVSKGRWSYHPNGYFVRFFPNGYPQTRVDVYVPYKDAVQKNKKGKAIGINDAANETVEVIFDPSGMVASPANRPSQRIGVTPVPVNPSEEYVVLFYSYPKSTRIPTSSKKCERKTSLVGHVFMAFTKNGVIEKVKGLSPINEDGDGGGINSNTDESYLLGYHTKCFAVRVTKQQYYNALAIRTEDWFAGTNDCVSYAVMVAEALNLKTSTTTDMIAFPDTYLDYLITNNPTVRIMHQWCNITPKCPDEVIVAVAIPKSEASIQQKSDTPINNNNKAENNLSSIPNLPLSDINGASIILSDMVQKDKNYVIILWGNWMDGCKKILTDWKIQYPNWQKVLNLEVIAIHITAEPKQIEGVRNSIKQYGWPYSFYFCDGWKKAAQAFDSEAIIPYIYIIKGNRIIEKQCGSEGTLPFRDATKFDKRLTDLLQN